VTSAGNYWLGVTSEEGCTGYDTVVVMVCVGVEHLNLAGLHIYPNPTTDVVHIQQSTQAQLNFKVYDATGRLVFSQFSSESEVVIDVRKLAPGVHLLEIMDAAGNRTSTSFIKE
jgi:hypothetical protein